MPDTKESLRKKREAYRLTFCGTKDVPHPAGGQVLDDLKKFCGITKPGIVIAPQAGAVDPYASIYRAAQRDVYLRICGFLGIDDKTLFKETIYVDPQESGPKTAES